MVGESYQRAYGTLVSAQMLSELEEIITFRLVKERRPAIQTMWWDRLQVRAGRENSLGTKRQMFGAEISAHGQN